MQILTNNFLSWINTSDNKTRITRQKIDTIAVDILAPCVARSSKREDFNDLCNIHDDVIKWKHFPCYWSLVRGMHRSPVNSPHEGQWRGALMFSLICAWINGWVNNGEAGDLRRHRSHYYLTVMLAMEKDTKYKCISIFYQMKSSRHELISQVICWQKSIVTWAIWRLKSSEIDRLFNRQQSSRWQQRKCQRPALRGLCEGIYLWLINFLT